MPPAPPGTSTAINWFGSATSAINNFGTINVAGNGGFYAVVLGAALTFNNFGTVEILPGGFGQIGGAVTGGTAPAHGQFLIDDRAALEFTSSVILHPDGLVRRWQGTAEAR